MENAREARASARRFVQAARSEKSQLKAFLESFEIFSLGRPRKLKVDDLGSYKMFFPRAYQRFKSQLEIHMQEIDEYIQHQQDEADQPDSKPNLEPDSPVTRTQRMIDDAKEAIHMANSEKQRVRSFLSEFEKLSKERGKLSTSHLDAYHSFIPKALEEVKSELENYMKDLDMYIHDKQKERDEHILKIRHQAYDSSLVHRIPFDILGLIFAESVRITPTSDNTSLRLARVSTTWRNVALRTPQVWSKLAVDVRGPSTWTKRERHVIFDVELARRFVQRGGRTPLHLSVSWGINREHEDLRKRRAELISSSNDRLVEFAFHNSGRSHGATIEGADMEIIFRNPMPNLSSLTYSGPALQSAAVPLQGISVVQTVTLCSPLAVKVEGGLDALRVLRLREICYSLLEFCDPWLLASSSLRVLSIKHRHWAENHIEGKLPSTPIVLPCLEELDILSFQYCEKIFEVIKTPALQTLKISVGDPYDHYTAEAAPQYISTFLDNAAPGLRSPGLPCLRSFSLDYPTGIDKNDALDNALKKFLQAPSPLSHS